MLAEFATEFVTSSFLLPDPQCQPNRAALARLHVDPATEIHAAHSDNGDLEVELTKLSRAGLVCRSVVGQRLRILGGVTTSIAEGIKVYEHPFTIVEDDDGQFTVTIVSARSFPHETAVLSTLPKAIEKVTQEYRRRGMLSYTGRLG